MNKISCNKKFSLLNNNVFQLVRSCSALRNMLGPPPRGSFINYSLVTIYICVSLCRHIKQLFQNYSIFYRIYRSLTLFRWVLWVYTSDFTKITSYKIIKPGIYRLSNTILPCIHIYFIKEKYSIVTLNYNR